MRDKKKIKKQEDEFPMKAHSGNLRGKIRGTDLSGTIGGLVGFRSEKKKKDKKKKRTKDKETKCGEEERDSE